MTDIPNTSESPYYLKRIQSRGPGDAGAGSAGYSLRSIPAWDPNYLGSSLLAKRIRKTLAAVEDRINAVATGGVDYNLLQQMVNDVLAGMNLEGLNEAQVNALIAAAVSEFGDTLTAEVATAIQTLIDGGQLGAGGGVEQAVVEALIATALGRPFSGPLNVAASVTAGVQGDTAQVVAFHPDNKPVSLDLQAPGGQVTVNGERVQTEADVIAKVRDILSKSPIITSPNISDPRIGGTVFTIGGTRVLSLEHVDENTWLKISNGVAGPEIGVKPLTGSTIDGNIRLRPLGRGAVEIGTATSSATVRSVGDLTPDIDLVLEAQGDGKVKIGDSPVVTEKFLGDNIGPALQAAIASQVGHVEEKFDIDTRTAGDGFVSIVTNNLTSAQHKVGLNFVTQRDGEVTVNGKRVLTTEDALAAGGAGIDQAALEAAVQAATAPLLARIDALEAEVAKRPTTEYMQEQFGNFNDLLSADISQTAQLVLAEQAKLQRVIDLLGGDQTIGTTTVEQAVAVFSGLNTIIADNIVAPAVEAVENKLMAYMNAVAGKTNPTPTEVRRALDEIAEYAQQVEQWANQMISDVVDYVALEFTKYATKDEFTALNAELEGFANEAVPAMVQSELENRIPAILDALQTHLENVLAIFGGGGTTGVTPAQIAELSAEFARLYATKEQLAAYAKLDDGNQEINAGLVKARGVQFTINDEVLVPLDFDDYGTRLSLIPHTATSVDDAGIVVLHTDLADLIPGAKES